MNLKYKYSFRDRLIIHFYKILNKDAFEKYLEYLVDRDLRKYGPEILKKVSETAQDMNVDYWLTWGSILGYYREHDIIFGDNDIDIGMFDKDISVQFVDNLIKKGFLFCYAIADKDYKGFHFVLNYKNVKVDFYSFHLSEDKKTYTGFAPNSIEGNWERCFVEKKFGMKWISFPYEGTVDTEFLNVRTRVPKNIEEQLIILYGENFMTPIPGYKCKANDNVVIEFSDVRYALYYEYDAFKNFLINIRK